MRRRHCSYCFLAGHTRRTCPELERRARVAPYSAEAVYKVRQAMEGASTTKDQRDGDRPRSTIAEHLKRRPWTANGDRHKLD